MGQVGGALARHADVVLQGQVLDLHVAQGPVVLWYGGVVWGQCGGLSRACPRGAGQGGRSQGTGCIGPSFHNPAPKPNPTPHPKTRTIDRPTDIHMYTAQGTGGRLDSPLPEELDVGRGLDRREARVLNLDGLRHGSLYICQLRLID